MSNPRLLAGLRHFALYLTGSPEDADELFSQTMLQGWHSLTMGKFEDRNGRGLAPWLRGVMRHVRRQQTRYEWQGNRDARRTESYDTMFESHLPYTPSETASLDNVLDALRVVSNFPQLFQDTARLMAQGYDRHEIAEQLAISPLTVKTRMFKIRQRLQTLGVS